MESGRHGWVNSLCPDYGHFDVIIMYDHCYLPIIQHGLGLKKIIVWLSSTTFFWEGAGGWADFFFFLDFFFSNQSQSYTKL